MRDTISTSSDIDSINSLHQEDLENGGEFVRTVTIASGIPELIEGDHVTVTSKKSRGKGSLEESEKRYTVFSKSEKYLLLIIAAASSIFSSLGSPIYYPALGTLEKYFNISEEMVNLSVVLYLVAQAISPTIFASAADIFGRRPIIILCLLIFIGASIGIAVIKNYPALLVLRFIQSAGISPTISITSGLVGDFTQRHERGGYMGLLSGLALTGQGFGSLIGAGLIAGFDWRAIFWFLVIASSVVLSFIIFLLPETKRTIVGNGSVIPQSIFNRAPILYLSHVRKAWDLDTPDIDLLVSQNRPEYFAPFKIMAKPELFILLLNQGLHMALWVVLLTSLTTQLSKNYNFTVLKIGFSYLPAGIAGLVGSIISGRLLDWNFKRNLKNFNSVKENSTTFENEAKFNIVKARMQLAFPYNIVAEVFAIIFGWILDKNLSIAGLYVTSFITCLFIMSVTGIVITLLVDMYPQNSSGAVSAVNFTRCGLAAIFVAALASMNKTMTVGGTINFIAGLGMLSTVSLIIPYKYGMKWVEERNREAKVGSNGQEK
ncbi:hypothetical protein WICMUC_001391 [Wickerhamomyces mucosus]|uniref:Major facilitator superfamily (MFS) profile domain-containing protein n=1 Tax=Wickerhamomyces mucosus TaxID=1378264 RepID=A0A9P8PW60_9ASCO|nr:hypothetical protein WICMUC_001391 [Wickerhamomyces mucosus]